MDFFSILSSGAVFDRKRFKSDVALFKPTEITAASDINEEIPQVLDFFNPPTKKQKAAALSCLPVSNDEGLAAVQSVDETLQPLDTKEQTQAFRQKHKIRVFGTDVANPIQSFSDLFLQHNIRPFLQKSINDMNYKTPTPIQMQSIPLVLSGRDVLACAPTGSGKTLAFGLPILHALKAPAKFGFRAVIISPTRELAQQISREIKRLAASKPFKICVLTTIANTGNANSVAQFKNFDILISTPLRLVTALKMESIKLDSVQHIVFDEADKLLEEGFLEQVDEILASCTLPTLQSSLFSATIPSSIETLAKSFQKDAVRIIIGESNSATSTISQKLEYVGSESGKLIAVRQLVQNGGMTPPVLIFTQSIDRAKQLFHELVYDGINVDVIHSERTRAQRDSIIQNFRTGKTWILISTDLIARGLDFKGVKLVINYDFPTTVASYIHRIGRSGRAGSDGSAVTFFTKDDGVHLKSVVNVMQASGCDVAEWMLSIKKPSKKEKESLKRSGGLDRDDIKTISSYDERNLKRKKDMTEGSIRRALKKVET